MRLGTALATTLACAGAVGALTYGAFWAYMSIDRLINPAKTMDYESIASGDVRGALKAASRATGVDFAYLAAEAALESGLNPAAKAKTSSAAGLFQFIESTWAGMVERHGAKIGLEKEAKALASGDISPAERRRIMDLRYNAGVAARLGAEFAAENKEYLEARIGREPEDVDLYLAHFLGPGGAVKFLRQMEASPDGAAATAFPAAAKANRAVFYRDGQALSFSEIRDRFDKKLEARAGDVLKAPPATGTRVDEAWTTAPAAPSGAASPRPVAAGLAPVGRPASVASPAALAGMGRIAGDPWLTTLVNVQMSMNSDLARIERQDEADRAYRSLLG